MKRRIGLASAVVLVIANMIGAGVFTTSGLALADLGTRERVLVAWAIGGVLAMCGALSYGALARHIPESGGEYLFLARTVHPLAGFLAGWVSLLAGFTAPIAASALGLQAYLADSFGVSARPQWIGTAAIVAAGLMHGLWLLPGVVLQNFAVALKLVLIAGIIGMGILFAPSSPALTTGSEPFRLTTFAVSLIWISFAYSGWNAAVYVGGEVRDPDRNLHRALWLATALVTIVYLALNAVFLYAADPRLLAGKIEIGAIAADALGGVRLRRVVSALVALALFTSISSMVMAGPRVYARMADDGLLPRFVAAGRDLPRTAVMLQVGLALIVLWNSDLVELLGYIGFTLGLSAAATVAALMALRRRGPDRLPVPAYPWAPLLFIVTTLLISGFMAAREPWQALLGLVTVAAGLPVYALMRATSRSGVGHR